MPRKEAALAVLLGVVAFGFVASRSLFVEGEATGGIIPGFHPTTELAFDTAARAGAVDADAVRSGDVETVPAVHGTSGGKDIPAGYVYWKTVRAKVTAYDPSRRSCGRFADGKTSIGQSAWVMDGVAADPRAIPYGTVVTIPGAGVKEVDDTGSAMRRSWRKKGVYHIDLRVKYPYIAKRWGVKYMDVRLYRKAR